MPHPIVCLDERLRKYLHTFHALFSHPQFEHFVTVLVALLMSLEGQTLSHLHRARASQKESFQHQSFSLAGSLEPSGRDQLQLFSLLSYHEAKNRARMPKG